MRRLQIGHADAAQAGFGRLKAVRMLAVDGLGVGPANHRAGAGVGLFQRGLQPLALALPDGVRIRRLGNLPRRQRHRLVEQRRIGQRAQ